MKFRRPLEKRLDYMSDGNNDLGSVWLKFTEKNMGVMRGEGRANHPSRGFVNAAMEAEFRNRHFNWLDVGTVGMIDYEYFSGTGADFTYTGADISAPIIEDSKSYLRNDVDRIIKWDISQKLDENTPLEPGEKFDLVTMRHIVNHLSDYVTAIKNAKNLLADNGLLIITFHITLVEKPSEMLYFDGYPTDEPGTVIRHHISRSEFFDVVTPLFEISNFTRFKDRGKPNDVVILRNVENPTGDIPKAHNIQMRSLIWRITRATAPKFIRRTGKRILRGR